MVISDRDLLKLIASSELKISSLDIENVREHSISLHLGEEVFELSSCEGIVDVKDQSTYPNLHPVMDNDYFIMERGKVYLAPVKELISIPDNICAYVDGTSDLARLGISIVLCGHVAPGFGGHNGAALVLEMQSHALQKVKLYSGMRVANLVFSALSSTCNASYKNRKEAYTSKTSESSKLFHRLYVP